MWHRKTALPPQKEEYMTARQLTAIISYMLHIRLMVNRWRVSSALIIRRSASEQLAAGISERGRAASLQA